MSGALGELPEWAVFLRQLGLSCAFFGGDSDYEQHLFSIPDQQLLWQSPSLGSVWTSLASVGVGLKVSPYSWRAVREDLMGQQDQLSP